MKVIRLVFVVLSASLCIFLETENPNPAGFTARNVLSLARASILSDASVT